ncbi:MAG: glycosyl hydrolase, partial [Myxococcales bacterium]|nr:glycosyl hydrolase [Myxococcales bacterium]
MKCLSLRCAVFILALLFLASPALAQAPQRSWFDLVSSNGFSGVVVNLQDAKIHHFREHIYASEEPLWTSEGEEVWLEEGTDCFKPQSIYSRDLLYDAYFGLAVEDDSLWLSDLDVDM